MHNRYDFEYNNKFVKSISSFGGLRVRLISQTWPLARLTLDYERILINSVFLDKITIKKEDVVHIEKILFLPHVMSGISITYKSLDIQTSLIFWSFKTNDLISTFTTLKYIK